MVARLRLARIYQRISGLDNCNEDQCLRISNQAVSKLKVHSRGFERLQQELGFELCSGHTAEIRTKRVRKQKTESPGW
jgi:hypothetical protein